MNTDNLLRTDVKSIIGTEFIASMLVMILIIFISFLVYFKQKKYDPIKDKPSLIISLAEMFVEKNDSQVKEIMGVKYKNFGGYFSVLTLYMMLCFIIGIMGIPNFIYLGEDTRLNTSTLFAPLSNPFVSLVFPLSIGLITFVLIQTISIRYKKWKYLKQFIAPIPFVGLLSVWVPLLSLSLRLFGNAFTGYCLSSIAYQGLNELGNGVGLIAVPFVMPFFHFYFDLFSGYIQTLVFTSLSMIDIAQEGPSIEEQIEMLSLKAKIE